MTDSAVSPTDHSTTEDAQIFIANTSLLRIPVLPQARFGHSKFSDFGICFGFRHSDFGISRSAPVRMSLRLVRNTPAASPRPLRPKGAPRTSQRPRPHPVAPSCGVRVARFPRARN